MTEAAQAASMATVEPRPGDKRALSKVELLRISLYWLAISGLWAGHRHPAHAAHSQQLICPPGVDCDACATICRSTSCRRVIGDVRLRPEVAAATVLLVGLDRRFRRPAHRGRHERLHAQPPRTPAAMDPGRHLARRRLPDRRSRTRRRFLARGRPHRPAPVLEQPRPGPVPGLRARPRAGAAGRPGVGSGGHDDRQRPAGRRRHRRRRHRLGRTVRLGSSAWRCSRSARCCRPSSASPIARSRCPSGRAACVAGVAGARRPRRGRIGASCGCWSAGSSSS